MASNPQQIQAVFLKVVEVPPEDRATLLDQVCAGDAELRQRVESLLMAHDQPDSLLDRPVVHSPETHAPAIQEPPVELLAGARVGPYRLVDKLGEGGMGAVWIADQEQPVRRRVALKLIKPGLDSGLVVRRFEQERQALALMDHTNIARILDAGVFGERGRPYFVMELVKGVPLTTYCDELHLSVRERLGLFVPVCRAVQHAHQKGIIHRDLKPTNVLVCMQDGRPVPKVIDFGVAKAVHQDLTEETHLTRLGVVVGTLQYMSPEQAELSALDVDTRADVYALGVMLYELLTGTTPLETVRPKTAPFSETLRLIREKDPPTPSTRLREMRNSERGMRNEAPSRGQRVSIPHSEFRIPNLRELDWIVMKCLEKDRTRRYETANSLARDVERYLADEPVEAGPPSSVYRVKKFVHRNRGAVVAAVVIVVALVGGIVGTTWGMLRAQDARRDEAHHRGVAEDKERAAVAAAEAERQAKVRAERENRIADAVRSFLSDDLLLQADPSIQADSMRRAGDGFEPRVNPTVRDLLDRAAAAVTPDRIEGKFPGQPEVQAQVLATLGSAYIGVREYTRAVDHLSRSVELCHASFGPYDRRTLTARTKLAWAYSALGQDDRAAATLHEVWTAAEREYGKGDRFTLQSANNLGQVYVQGGRVDLAAPLFAQVREAAQTLPPDDPLSSIATHNLALTLKQSGELRKAIPLYEEARDGAVRILTADHTVTLSFQKHLADAYLEDGQTGRAIAIYEQLPAAMIRWYGAGDSRTLAVLTRLATAYLMTRQYDKAVPLLEQTRVGVVERGGVGQPTLINTLFQLAIAYKATERFAAAVEAAEQMRDIAVKHWGVGDPRTVKVVQKLAEVCVAAGRGQQAAAAFGEFIPVKRKELGAANADFAGILALAANDLLKVGQFAAAEEYARESLRIREKVLPDSWLTPDTRLVLGSALAGQDNFTDAEPLLLDAYDGLGKSQAIPPPVRLYRLAEAADQLSALYTATGERDKAEEWRAKRRKYPPHQAPPPRAVAR